MNKLTAGICCFALAGLFAWVSASSVSSVMNAQSHATAAGAFLLIEHTQPNWIIPIAQSAVILMLLIGLACVVSGLRSNERKQS
ncbi:MAG: hypothetical protein ACR2HH_15840 [Chthoniobacterales bacterium]